MKIGANYLGNGRCEFVAWAPLLKKLELKIVSPQEKIIPMEKIGSGYWKATAENIYPGTQYFFRLDEANLRPDPASQFQPQGVHGPSRVVDQKSFKWQDRGWRGVALKEMVIYELHIGTFTKAGDFKSVIERLPELKSLGINAIEIMPVAQFPGERNWGYDGVYPFAVQNSYGGPAGLKELVNAAHKEKIAVILDVVYNHFGPEGNYTKEFAPYFSDRYKAFWGDAINFDGPQSDEVRKYFVENTLYWFRDFHIDALRLDAIHGIFDFSAYPFLQELAKAVKDYSKNNKRKYYLIAESDLNDTRIIRPEEAGGFGIPAQWCDDFHHALHTLLTKENSSYYVDFGSINQMTKAFQEGFVYSGQYSKYRKRKHGNSSAAIPADQFIVFSQNHDQVGNRRNGERLSKLTSFEGLKLAAGAIFFSPYIPLIFMGEEYAEDKPFLYFISHSDQALIEAVRKGRGESLKDPVDIEAFTLSKISWEKRRQGKHQLIFKFYQQLIKLRKTIPALSNLSKEGLEVKIINNVLLLRRRYKKGQIIAFFNFSQKDISIKSLLAKGKWDKVIDSSEAVWGGPKVLGEKDLALKPLSFILYKSNAHSKR